MKTLRKIAAITDGKFIEKVGKYVLELSFHDDFETGEFWLSEKQASKLFEVFNIDFDACDFPISPPKVVHGAFEERGEYLNFIWCTNDKKIDWMHEKFGPFENVGEIAA